MTCIQTATSVLFEKHFKQLCLEKLGLERQILFGTKALFFDINLI